MVTNRVRRKGGKDLAEITRIKHSENKADDHMISKTI